MTGRYTISSRSANLEYICVIWQNVELRLLPGKVILTTPNLRILTIKMVYNEPVTDSEYSDTRRDLPGESTLYLGELRIEGAFLRIAKK